LQYHVPKGSGSMPPIKKRPSQYLAENLYVTTSGNFLAAAFHCTQESLGIDRICLGTDYPFETTTEIDEFLGTVGMAPDDERKLYEENPLRLGFGL